MVSRRTLLTGAAGATALAAAGALALTRPWEGATEARLAALGTLGADPLVSGLSSDTLPLEGGELVISGRNLEGVESVTVGERAARILDRSDRSITLYAPNQLDYAEAEAAVLAHTTEGASLALASVQYRVTTDVDRQMQYAFRYWKNYNDAKWGDYNGIGGDCTNFANQTLIARGWEMNSKWKSGGTVGTSTPTWYYSPAIEEYLDARHPRLQGREVWSQVRIGDLVLFDWEPNDTPNHTMIVSEVYEREGGETGIRCVGHNLDIRYRDLDDDVLPEYPDFDVWFYSLSTRL